MDRQRKPTATGEQLRGRAGSGVGRAGAQSTDTSPRRWVEDYESKEEVFMTSASAAALISQMDPPPGEDREFDAWYAEEHVPLRMDVPGFVSALRARAVQGEPSHLVIYHLKSREVLSTPKYKEVKDNPSELTRHMLGNAAAFTRFTGDLISDTGDSEPGRYLYLVTFGVPEDFQEEFDAWYERDHLRRLMRNPDWLRCRRYAIADSDPAGVTRAAVHELAELSALSSPEREAARGTPWRSRLSRNDWFSSARYAVYERFQDFEGTAAGSE
jgi:hypothetical protein